MQLGAQDALLRLEDKKITKKKTRANLDRCIQIAKLKYKQHVEDNFKGNDVCNIWQVIKNITDYKHTDNVSLVDDSFPDQLNTFFAHFEDSSYKGTSISIDVTENGQLFILMVFQAM